MWSREQQPGLGLGHFKFRLPLDLHTFFPLRCSRQRWRLSFVIVPALAFDGWRFLWLLWLEIIQRVSPSDSIGILMRMVCSSPDWDVVRNLIKSNIFISKYNITKISLSYDTCNNPYYRRRVDSDDTQVESTRRISIGGRCSQRRRTEIWHISPIVTTKFDTILCERNLNFETWNLTLSYTQSFAKRIQQSQSDSDSSCMLAWSVLTACAAWSDLIRHLIKVKKSTALSTMCVQWQIFLKYRKFRSPNLCPNTKVKVEWKLWSFKRNFHSPVASWFCCT